MTAGDEPQLGGQDHDNAPMISGRGTKIIADARGAYLAGNLQALFEAMNTDQQQRYCHAIIRGLYEFHLPAFEQAAADHPEIRDTLNSLTEWINHPTDENQQRVRRPPNPNLWPYESGFNIYDLAYALHDPTYRSIDYLWQTMLRTMGYAPPLSMRLASASRRYYWALAEQAFHLWMLDSAWSILHGKSIQPLRLDLAAIEALLADKLGWYRKGKLVMLAYSFTDPQLDQFKRIVRTQAVRSAERLPIGRFQPEDRFWLERAQQWLVHPQIITTEAVTTAIWQSARKKSQFDRLPTIMRYLMECFRDNSNDRFLDIRYTDAAARVDGEISQWMGGSKFQLAFETTQRWHLDVAYAILTDHPIPPLGDPNDR